MLLESQEAWVSLPFITDPHHFLYFLPAPVAHCWSTEEFTFSLYPAKFQNRKGNASGRRQYMNCKHPLFPIWSVSFLSLGLSVPRRPSALPFGSTNLPSTNNTSSKINHITQTSINITSNHTAQRSTVNILVSISIALYMYTHTYTQAIQHTQKYCFRLGPPISRLWIKLEKKLFYLGGKPRSTHRGEGICRLEESPLGGING